MAIHRSTKVLISKAAWCTYNTYRKGLSFPSQYSITETLFNSSRDNILEYQRTRVRQLIQHAVQTTPYYRDLFKAIGLSHDDLTQLFSTDSTDISIIPPLEKKSIRDQLHNLLSENRS